MPRYIAFLRGINVGGHRVKMDPLRKIFMEMGFTEIKTILASGNVVFSSPSKDTEALSKKIEAQLTRQLGYAVPTLIRTPVELKAIHERAQEYTEERPAWAGIYVMFFPDILDRGIKSGFQDLETDTDNFRFSSREVLWLVQGKLSDSPLFKTGFGDITGELPTTMRNLNTVKRVLAVL